MLTLRSFHVTWFLCAFAVPANSWGSPTLPGRSAVANVAQPEAGSSTKSSQVERGSVAQAAPSTSPTTEPRPAPPQPGTAPAPGPRPANESEAVPAADEQVVPPTKSVPLDDSVQTTESSMAPAPVPRIEPTDDYENSPPSGAAPPTADQASPSTTRATTIAVGPPTKPEKPKFNTLLLAEAIAKYGTVGDSLNSEDSDRDGYSAGLFGGQATLGLMPGGKYFTMAARLSGGAFVGGPQVHAIVGAAMMFGANFLRNERGDTYSYALGGAGVQFVPGLNQDMLALHLSGGTVINSLSFSAGVDIGSNEEFGFAIFGLQLGWGHMY